MAAIKENSTIQLNKKTALLECPVTYIMNKIGGYWKPIILFHLLSGTKRYNELKKAIPTITEKMLIQHLKQMEADGLVNRKARPVVPPYVEYSLTRPGKELRPILESMAQWAIKDGKRTGLLYSRKMENFPKEKG